MGGGDGGVGVGEVDSKVGPDFYFVISNLFHINRDKSIINKIRLAWYISNFSFHLAVEVVE